MTNALTVDVEEHFQVEAFADSVAVDQWPLLPSRVTANTLRTLELFAELGLRATFFVVGWVAERNPQLLREIAAAGHEVGCHSYLHQHLERLSPEAFRQDTRRARAVIEDATGMSLKGYRAPSFSVTRRTLWALEILAEEGFRYDASVFPVRHDVYGMADAPRFPFRWSLPSGAELYEFPASTARFWGQNLPTGGGGYLRMLPLRYVRWTARRIIQGDGQPLMVYFHPWEIDPEQPRMAGRWRSRLRHYHNLNGMEARLRALLSGKTFAPAWDVLQRYLQTHEVPAIAAPAALMPAAGSNAR